MDGNYSETFTISEERLPNIPLKQEITNQGGRPIVKVAEAGSAAGRMIYLDSRYNFEIVIGNNSGDLYLLALDK